MPDESPLFVARERDLDALQARWAKVLGGSPQTVRVQAPFGGGRRALCSEFLRRVQEANEEAILWRVTCLDQENGVQWLVRMYGSLMATLTADVLRRGKIEMVLNAQLPGQPKRVQGWYQQFIAAMKEAKTDKEKGQVQLRIPQDNPLLGLVEVVLAIARKIPVILELQNPYAVNSVSLAMFVEALHVESRESNAKLLALLFDEPDSEVTRALHPMPLLDLYARVGDGIATHVVDPWGAEEVQAFLASKGLQGNAARLAQIASGRPGFIHEVTEILAERGTLEGDLEGVTLASLVPLDIDEDELDVPEEPPAEGERKHAGPDDRVRIAHFAALLGHVFPSGLAADMGGFDRESVDDLVDAMPDLFEEVEFSKAMNTWLYRFTRGAWREGILEHSADEESRAVARRVGLFMERYLVPTSYGFIVKTARVYAENGSPDRAAVMRALALSNDHADVWGLCYDFSRYFDEIPWPAQLKRTVYMNLVERLVATGSVPAAEQIHTQVSEWATQNDDRELTAWLLYAGSRLDARRQDHFRARDRARDALKLYQGLGNGLKVAEIHNHIATIELQDGNGQAALDRTAQALEAGMTQGPEGQKLVAPVVLATAEHIRGSVARRAGKLPEAIEHFKEANNVAGQTGLGALALDSGLSYGEAMLASGQTEQALQALERVLQIARRLQNPSRERSACELLGQACARLGKFAEAIPYAQRTLELSQQLKFDQALPIDLYHMGFFYLMTQKPTEALTFFRESKTRVGALGNHPVVRELAYFKGLAHLQAGELGDAKAELRGGLKAFQAANDMVKLCGSLDALAQIEAREGHPEVAKKLLADAIGFAKQAGLKEQRKQLRKRLDDLEG